MAVTTEGSFEMFGTGSDATLAGAIQQGGGNVSNLTTFTQLIQVSNATQFDPIYSGPISSISEISASLQYRNYPKTPAPTPAPTEPPVTPPPTTIAPTEPPVTPVPTAGPPTQPPVTSPPTNPPTQPPITTPPTQPPVTPPPVTNPPTPPPVPEGCLEYSIFANAGVLFSVSYIDCDGNPNSINVPGGDEAPICSTVFPTVTAGSGTITLTGLDNCFPTPTPPPTPAPVTPPPTPAPTTAACNNNIVAGNNNPLTDRGYWRGDYNIGTIDTNVYPLDTGWTIIRLTYSGTYGSNTVWLQKSGIDQPYPNSFDNLKITTPQGIANLTPAGADSGTSGKTNVGGNTVVFYTWTTGDVVINNTDAVCLEWSSTITPPPVASPPTNPPTQPPVTNPPVTPQPTAPVTNPPVTPQPTAPVTSPPTNPPTQPPVTSPPTNPPTQPPVTNPPVTPPPVTPNPTPPPITPAPVLPCTEWELFCPSSFGDECFFDYTDCNNSYVSGILNPDTDATVCVKSGTTPFVSGGSVFNLGTSCTTPVTPPPTSPAPVTPNPTPAPTTPAPTTPSPVSTPAPTTPSPVAPTTPAPTTPSPVAPTTPAPVTPSPVAPPTTPSPVYIAPTTPSPIAPTTPSPVATPAPSTPSPIAPTTPSPVSTPSPISTPAPVAAACFAITVYRSSLDADGACSYIKAGSHYFNSSDLTNATQYFGIGDVSCASLEPGTWWVSNGFEYSKFVNGIATGDQGLCTGGQP